MQLLTTYYLFDSKIAMNTEVMENSNISITKYNCLIQNWKRDGNYQYLFFMIEPS